MDTKDATVIALDSLCEINIETMQVCVANESGYPREMEEKLGRAEDDMMDGWVDSIR